MTGACTSKSNLVFNLGDDEGAQAVAAPPGPGIQQLRLLNEREYKNSVRYILGVDPAESLVFGSRGNGYDTSAGGQMDAGLLNALFEEAQGNADWYKNERLFGQYPCFNEANVEHGCVENFVRQLTRKFFRRDLPNWEVHSYIVFYRDREAEDGKPEALKQLVTRFLISPDFLYRTEIGTASTDGSKLNQFEIASLISFTLTATTPDDLLLNDASQGKLNSENIRKHVRRLLETSEGHAQIVKFMKQWLRLDALDDMSRNPARYTKLESPEQGSALKREFELFVEDVLLKGDGKLTDAFQNNITFVNRHTAPLYGLRYSGDEFIRVKLDNKRSGLLTLASVMASHASSSDFDRDRPVQRGTLILRQLLCGKVGLPSGVDVVSAGNRAAAQVPNFHELTTREQFDIITQQEQTCVMCHSTFMPYGYVLGNYNARGEYVTQTRGRPINVSITDVGPKRKSYDNPVTFINDLSQDERVYKCFTKNFAKFVTGADDEKVEGLSRYFHAGFKRKKYSIKSLIEDFFVEEFLYQRKATP